MWAFPSPDDPRAQKVSVDEDNIEDSIRLELESMQLTTVTMDSGQLQRTQIFTPICAAMECVFFMRTRSPVVPTELAIRICTDARRVGVERLERRCRYANRITPVLAMDRATENGIIRVARRVLGQHFDLVNDPTEDGSKHDHASQDDPTSQDDSTGELDIGATKNSEAFTVSIVLFPAQLKT
jgi:tRNA acetyltransferase TAN1